MLQLRKLWVLPAAVAAGLIIWVGCQTGRMATPPPPQAVVELPANSLKPGPDDAKIAFVTAQLLEDYHYLQEPMDLRISTNFFDGYINSLDFRHEFFLQSDLDEFSRFRTNLDRLTINTNLAADLSPAFLIYQRFLERFEQRTAYVNELLKQDKFKFTGDDRIELDRRHAAFPKNLEEAQDLWRERVRYEYLQDKLSREISETNGVFTVKLPSDAATNIVAELQKHYYWQLHLMTNHDSDFVLGTYLNALAHAYDPHTDYFSAPHAQDFSITMNLSLFGIGAQLTEDDGYCTISSLLAGGPAILSKSIKERDRIVAVAQGGKPPMDVVDMDLEKVVQQIRGPKGTEVRLTICEAPDYTRRKVVSLIRDEIKIEDAEAKAKLLEIPDGHGGTNRLGIIDLPSFYAPVDPGSKATPKYTSVDVARLIKKLKQEHVSGIIVDLRSNPGGSLEEAIKFTGLFIKGGPVVQARDPGRPPMVESDSDPNQLYSGPLLVMVNRFSASAAEIAAAALQDYGRALVVGDICTHGKGTVQSLNQMRNIPFFLNSSNDPGTLKITIRKFYRISGASTQLKGVTPDLVLPDVANYFKQAGESNLDNPLPWDTIEPATYDKFNLVQPCLPELLARSEARVATNQDFDYIRQDIAQYQKMEADGTATLNERDAIKERERDTLRGKERDKEQQARADSGLRIVELAVKNTMEPGLPAPKMYLTTNFDKSATAMKVVVKSAGPAENQELAATNTESAAAPVPGSAASVAGAPVQVCYIFTNFFNPAYIAGFTNFFSTNCPTISEVQFVYTNSAATNLIAEYDQRPKGASPTFVTYKPSVGRTYMPDPMLDESVRIMEDYVSLLQKRGSLTANP
jgi:carboxyl-terminal processing protease